jgi:uncharacterized protein involved in type VI secretion and phage assembly
MGGASVGVVTMPSINDEVLVGFEQGDFRRPYVLGGLWNATDKPPYVPSDGAIVHYGLKTVSGHVMTFGEKSGEEAITFQHGKEPQTKLVLEKQKVQLWVGGENMIEIKAGGATIVLNQGNITISGKAIEIKADTDLKLSGLNVEVKANAGLKLEGATTADLKANATVNVQSSGQLALKGSMTMIN